VAKGTLASVVAVAAAANIERMRILIAIPPFGG
jgi:hypothetical protein